MTEEVEPRAHRRKDLVDMRLASVRTSPTGERPKRLRRFVRQEDVDVTKRLARLDLVSHEMPSLVGKLSRLGSAFLRMREIGRGRFVPGWRKRSAQAGELRHGFGSPDLTQRSVVYVMQ